MFSEGVRGTGWVSFESKDAIVAKKKLYFKIKTLVFVV